VVQGIATGTTTATVGAALVDLAPAGNPQLAPLVNSAAPTWAWRWVPLGSSFLIAYGPDPMRLMC
jgi:hypothetical protein